MIQALNFAMAHPRRATDQAYTYGYNTVSNRALGGNKGQ